MSIQQNWKSRLVKIVRKKKVKNWFDKQIRAILNQGKKYKIDFEYKLNELRPDNLGYNPRSKQIMVLDLGQHYFKPKLRLRELN